MTGLEDLRVKTAELLDEGLASGALTRADHSWRVGNLPRAQTVEDLENLVEDLLDQVPEGNGVVSGHPRTTVSTVLSTRSLTLGQLGRFTEVATVLGTTVVDLTGLGPGESLRLELAVVLGNVTVLVPPGIKVRVDPTVILGECWVDPSVADQGSAVRLTGEVVLGNLRVVPQRLAL